MKFVIDGKTFKVENKENQVIMSIKKINDHPYKYALIVEHEDGNANVYRFTNKRELDKWMKETN